MRLEHVCDLEMAYREEALYGDIFVMVRPYGGEEGAVYGEGDATFTGPRLQGSGRWVNHPHRRSDGIMIPDTHGLIVTTDGAKVLFSFGGRTVFEGEVGKQTLHVTLEAEDERYRWLNNSVFVLEGLIDSQTGRMKAHIYECLNELGSAGSPA
jgi:hypothetical protein